MTVSLFAFAKKSFCSVNCFHQIIIRSKPTSYLKNYELIEKFKHFRQFIGEEFDILIYSITSCLSEAKHPGMLRNLFRAWGRWFRFNLTCLWFLNKIILYMYYMPISLYMHWNVLSFILHLFIFFLKTSHRFCEWFNF